MGRKERKEARVASRAAVNELYDSAEQQPSLATSYSDGSDAYANKGYVIEFEHVPSTFKEEDPNLISFKAFVTAFNENYSSEWASETVFGRADPIYMFKNTTRTITLTFQVPAATEGEAFVNMTKVQRLVQFLYPAYSSLGWAQTIAQSPLVRLKLMNLIGARDAFIKDDFEILDVAAMSDAKEKSTGANTLYQYSKQGTFDSIHKAPDPTVRGDSGGSLEPDFPFMKGALGVIRNLTVNHNVDADVGVFEFAYGTIMPKVMEIAIDFAVIHEHALGWDNQGNFSNPWFPYGLNDSEVKGNASVKEALQASATRKSADQRQELRKKEMAQQALDNQRARYAGATGAARWRGDQRRADAVGAPGRAERRDIRRNEERASNAARRSLEQDPQAGYDAASWASAPPLPGGPDLDAEGNPMDSEEWAEDTWHPWR